MRQAIFNMIQAQAGTISHLPADARWLDLFAGTGSVGLEALSRGVRECHFVEVGLVQGLYVEEQCCICLIVSSAVWR